MGANIKKKLKKSTIANEIETEILNQAEEMGTKALPDTSLFFVDKGLDSKVKRKAERKERSDARKKISLVEEKLVQRKIDNKKRSRQDLKSIDAPKQGEYDLWGAPIDGGYSEKAKNEPFLEPTLKRRKIFKVESSLHQDKKIAFATMTTPSSGISYNPSFKDHQDVLAEAVAKEVEWKDKRAAEKRKPVLEEHYLIKDVAEYDNDDEDMEETNVVVANKPNTKKKKDQAKKNKQRKNKLLQDELERQRIEKRKLKELERVNILSRQVEKNSNRQIEKKKEEKKKQLEFAVKEGPKRKIRGKVIEELPKVMVSLTEDLSSTMRTLKALPSGKVIADHLENLHRQNKIEINTIRHQPKKRKLKESNRHKEMTLKELEAQALT